VRLAFVLLACFVTIGCDRSHPTQPVPSDWTGKSEAEMRILLNRVAANCDLPGRTFRLEHGKLTAQPDANEKYERFDCGLAAIKRIRGVPPLGFVGNGYYTKVMP